MVAVVVVGLLLGIVAQVDGVYVRSRGRRRLIYVERDGSAKKQQENELPTSNEMFDDFARDFKQMKGR